MSRVYDSHSYMRRHAARLADAGYHASRRVALAVRGAVLDGRIRL